MAMTEMMLLAVDVVVAVIVAEGISRHEGVMMASHSPATQLTMMVIVVVVAAAYDDDSVVLYLSVGQVRAVLVEV